MGLLDRFTKQRAEVPAKLMSDEQEHRLKDMQDMLNAQIAANPGALPDTNADPMVMAQWATQGAADAERIQRLQHHGVEASAIVRAVRPTGTPGLSGSQELEIDVSIRGEANALHEAQARQHMMPAQSERLTPGSKVTVKYEPEAPATAMLVNW